MNELFDINEIMPASVAEKTMTIQEVASSLGVSYDTVNSCINRLNKKVEAVSTFVRKQRGRGNKTLLTEEQVAVISKELKDNSFVGSKAEVSQATTRLEVIANYKAAAEAMIGMLQSENEQLKLENAKQKSKIAIDEPKVDFYNRFAGSYGDMCIRDGAKTLGYKRQQDFFELLGEKYTFETPHNRYMPYQKYIEQGLFKIKVGVSKSIPPFQTSTTHLTPKGLQYFASKLGEKK